MNSNSNPMLTDQAFKPLDYLGFLNNKDGSLVYMWIAHYEDGTSLPQFDPVTLKENHYSDIDLDKLIKFGLYPIPLDLALNLRSLDIPVKAKPNLPKIEIDITKDKRLIGCITRNWCTHIPLVLCPVCNSEFRAKSAKYTKSKYKSMICPHCGASNKWICPKCNRQYSTPEEPVEKYGWKECRCVNCDEVLYEKQIKFKSFSREERWRKYLIGYQQTINGKNYKTILYVDEDGNIEVKYD